MLAILFAHAVATAVAPLLVHRWGRMAFYPLALVPLGSLIWVALNWPESGSATTANVEWLPELSMNITLRFDSLAAIMSVLVLAIGALVLFYCADYFHHHRIFGCSSRPRDVHRKAATEFRRGVGRVLRRDVRARV